MHGFFEALYKMSQVSKKPISKDLSEEIVQELWWTLTKIKDEQEMGIFLGDLLTRTEKLMLAKRLALANLLLRGGTGLRYVIS